MSVLDIGTLGGRIELDNRLEVALDQAEEHVKHFAEEFFKEFEGLNTAVKTIAIGVGGLTAVITGIGASITALGVSGSRINDVETNFKRLAGGAENAEEVLKALRAGVVGTVNDLELMTNANKLLQAGVKANAEDLGMLNAAARILSKEGYGPLEEVLGNINRAEQTGKTTRLGLMGVTVNIHDAQQEYAKSIGTVASMLDDVGKKEAARFGILQAATKIVHDAGEQQMSFAEMVNATSTSLANWVEKLEYGIGTSASVARAWKAMGDALMQAFGGSSEEILKKVLGWVDDFADAVTKYGPMIVQWFVDVKDWVVKVYATIMADYDAIPNWFKEIAKNAIIAGGALLIAGKGISEVSSGWDDTLSKGANLSQMFGTSLPSAVKTTSSALKELYEYTAAFGKEGFVETLRSWLPTFASTAGSIGGLNIALDGAGLAGTSFVAAFAALIPWVAAAATTAAIGWQAWKLYSEWTEQSASDARQLTLDQVNLDRINTALGTHYKTLKEAQDAAADSSKKHVAITMEEAKANKAAADEIEKHNSKIQSMADSYIKAGESTKVFAEVFAKIHEDLREELANGTWQKLQKEMDGIIDKGEKLNDVQVESYHLYEVNAHNTAIAADALLRYKNVTLEQLEALKAQGLSMAGIAELFRQEGDSVVLTGKQLEDYMKSLTQMRDLNRKLADEELAFSGTAHDKAVAQHQREFEDAVSALDKQSNAYGEFYDKLAQLRDKKDKDDGSSWSQLAQQSKRALGQILDAAIEDYGRMEDAAGGFSQKALNEQRKKIDDARDALYGMGSTADATFEQMKKVVDQTDFTFRTWLANVATDAQKAALGFDSMGRKIADTGDAASKSAAQMKELAAASLQVTSVTSEVLAAPVKLVKVTDSNFESVKGQLAELQDLIDSYDKRPKVTSDPQLMVANAAAQQRWVDAIAQAAYLTRVLGEFQSQAKNASTTASAATTSAAQATHTAASNLTKSASDLSSAATALKPPSSAARSASGGGGSGIGLLGSSGGGSENWDAPVAQALADAARAAVSMAVAQANAARDAFLLAKQQGVGIEKLGQLAEAVRTAEAAMTDAEAKATAAEAEARRATPHNPYNTPMNRSIVGGYPTTIQAQPGTSTPYGPSVVIESGAITHNFPVVRDRQAMEQLASITGDAIVQKLTNSGWRAPSGVSR